MPRCLKWSEERTQTCSQTADQGHNECTQTRDDGYKKCCTWWPCSKLCKAWVWISSIVCIAWTWISKIVCIAWTWLTTAVCVLWDVVTAIVNMAVVSVESVFGWVLSAATFIIELVEMIPVVGAIIRWVINGVTWIANVALSLGDAFLGAIGIRPEKKLRICTVILKDEKGNPVATPGEVIPLLQLAAIVYKRDANVRLIPSRMFQYNTGFSDEEIVDDSWIVTDSASSSASLLDMPCDSSQELVNGTKLQFKSSTLCLFGSWRRVLGYGAPVTCFVIRDVTPDAYGCCLVITDYITIDKEALTASLRTIGHETGHSCLLWHTCVDNDVKNIMSAQDACNPVSFTGPDRSDPQMADWQALIVRASKHATYF